MRTGGDCRTVGREISRFPRRERPHMPGSLTTPGRLGLAISRPDMLPSTLCTASAPRIRLFRGSMAGLCAPLSTLRRDPREPLRMTRGRCGSLLLHHKGLAPSTPCRSPGALHNESAFTPTAAGKRTSKKCRSGPNPEVAYRENQTLLGLDSRRLDDRPPFLYIGLVDGSQPSGVCCSRGKSS